MPVPLPDVPDVPFDVPLDPVEEPKPFDVLPLLPLKPVAPLVEPKPLPRDPLPLLAGVPPKMLTFAFSASTRGS